MEISYSDFEKVDIRIGRVVEVADFPEARKPAYKLKIDLGQELGIKNSSAQITQNYSTEELLGTLVLCVVNFPPKQIGPFMSEALTLGVPDGEGQCVLISPNNDNAVIGGKLF